ncbi:glycosyltransferase family 4 protein [Effusibacillus lacus]|uniref:Glycosyl transferase n=1 Tax=Effusibacillus lacus TaxID=1348429 RepID=A0A292YU61_9BACL|nr:glycosyltransferase family 4 protein [Effusibacillus lacus]TCS73510.1 glycosyltransferase involved in cell wall biosynthesis [Effusibacillus lacus]GAX91994.1 glycosyl transferase [Effusibacillus lacus]
MKILLATFWYLPHVGGVDTYLRILREGLEKRGHQVDIMAHHPPMNSVYLVTGERVVEKKPILFPMHDMMMDYFDQELPDLDNWARYREIERYVFEMASVLLGLDDYDIIHTHDVISTRAFSRVKPANIPHVATIHGLLMEEFFITKEIEQEGTMRWKYSFVEEHLGASSPDATILPSEWLRREYINRFFVPPDNLTVIPYGLNTEKIIRETDSIKRIPRSDNKLVIICPARLVPYKGQRYLLEALAKLTGFRDDFVCQFAGDGQMRKELEELAEELNLQDHVEFLGNRKDIHYLFKQADLFVLPTLVENHSLAVMEAQVTGLPVITTRVGGNPELVSHLHTGMLVEPRSVMELCQAILTLMNNPELRKNMAENSKHWARKYWRPDIMVERTLDVYRKAADKYK